MFMGDNKAARGEWRADRISELYTEIGPKKMRGSAGCAKDVDRGTQLVFVGEPGRSRSSEASR
jgi:hypothetical protein